MHSSYYIIYILLCARKWLCRHESCHSQRDRGLRKRFPRVWHGMLSALNKRRPKSLWPPALWLLALLPGAGRGFLWRFLTQPRIALNSSLAVGSSTWKMNHRIDEEIPYPVPKLTLSQVVAHSSGDSSRQLLLPEIIIIYHLRIFPHTQLVWQVLSPCSCLLLWVLCRLQ